MRSLFVGNIDNVVKDVIKYFDNQDDKKNNDVYRKGKLNFKKLFFCKEYDIVYYFAKDFNDDIDDLNNFLHIVNNSNNIKKYVYIVRSNSFDIDSNNEKVKILKDIFASYSKNKNKNIILLNTSCVYSKNYIDGEINNIKNTKKLDNVFGNYIHIEDFSRFIYMIGSRKVSIDYVEFKNNNLIDIKQLIFGDNKVISSNINHKNLFDYKFEHSIVDDLNGDLNINNIIQNNISLDNNNYLIKLLEIMIMFIIFELLYGKFNNSFNIQFVDFRLIYLIIVAIYYNKKFSLLATVLVITSFIITNINTFQDLSYLFSNTDNWLTVIIYIIMTILIRTKIEKFEFSIKSFNDKIINLKEEKRINERNIKKYEMRIKELNKELLIHNNSFSKVSNIVTNYNKINKETVYKIFLDSINEENIIVYDVNDKNCYPCDSKNKLSISKISKLLSKNKIWINRELEDKLPLYIVPIYHNKKIIYYVTIWSYDINMMNNEFKNNLLSLSNIISYKKDSDKE